MDNAEQSLQIAKDIVIGKIKNQISFMHRIKRKNNFEFEKIKKIDKEFFSKWNEKIENLLVDFKIKNLKNDRNGYKYFYLTDKNGKVVDFKDFSENSIALSLIDNIDKEVEKFSKIIIEIIRKLKNK